MKIRYGFVTNSSSSSFVLAKKETFTDEQKEVILNYVEKKLMGKKVASNKEELDKFFQKYYYVDDVNSDEFKKSYKYKDYAKCLKALEDGLIIYGGNIDFEFCEYQYADILADLWKELENKDSINFVGIDTSLQY